VVRIRPQPAAKNHLFGSEQKKPEKGCPWVVTEERYT